jgi:hypothetical protein
MAIRKTDGNDNGARAHDGRAAIAAARAEVVDILAGALFTLLLDGHVHPPRADRQEQFAQRS